MHAVGKLPDEQLDHDYGVDGLIYVRDQQERLRGLQDA